MEDNADVFLKVDLKQNKNIPLVNIYIENKNRDTHRQTKHFLIGGSSLLDGV